MTTTRRATGGQEPRRGLAQAVYMPFIEEVTAFIAAVVAKMGGNLLPGGLLMRQPLLQRSPAS